MKFSQLYNLLARFGIRSSHTDQEAEAVHRALQHVHSHFGLLRFQMGALLLAVKQQELWKGRAQSFAGYLEEEKIKMSAARQYMKVAEKLMFELRLEEDQLQALSRTSMTTLAKACEKMNADNMDVLISQMTALSDRDAKYVLDNDGANVIPLHHPQPSSPHLGKAVREYFSLPHDERIEFMRRIHGREAGEARKPF